MNIEIINKLDEITSIIKNDKDIKRYKELKQNLLSNEDLIKKINNLKKYEEFSSKYVDLKKEILNNKEYKEYVYLEKEVYFLVQQMNKKMNSLVEKRVC